MIHFDIFCQLFVDNLINGTGMNTRIMNEACWLEILCIKLKTAQKIELTNPFCRYCCFFFDLIEWQKKIFFLFQSFIQQVSRLLSKKIAIYISTPFLVLFFSFSFKFLFVFNRRKKQSIYSLRIYIHKSYIPYPMREEFFLFF